jgi:Protein of unknown function (DUF3570)
VVVAVVATKNILKINMKPKNKYTGGAALLLAACALPGVLPVAHAETIPEFGTISTKILSYQQKQPDGAASNQSSVVSPSVYISAPMAGEWLVEGSLTHDNVSGASPRYHTTGASHMSDERTAGDIRIKRYFSHATVSVGAAYSTEHDYQSTALSVLGTLSSDDNNTTWSGGLGFNNDRINPVNKIVVNEKKRGFEVQMGVTQVLTPVDIAQLNLSYSDGSGYYSDPYKPYDNRPRDKRAGVLLAKWNHYLKGLDATTRLSYRIYSDSYGIVAHTVGFELVKPLADGWTVTPSLRYYTQSKADFYYDPPFPNGQNTAKYYSADQRLASVGAITAGIKVSKQLTLESTLDFKLSHIDKAQASISGLVLVQVYRL